MSYQATLDYLYGLQKHGMKFGLDNITRLMDACGQPHRSFLSVHIAGTNGKGSTGAMMESILRTGGLRTGLFTSPHLINFTERIRINGQEISESDVMGLADEVRELSGRIDDFSPTFFEVVTTMAFIHFRRMGVQWAVVETGLGGRLDSTNIIHPEVSVITKIGSDHCEFLGNTIGEIAAEKAGIIKQDTPVVTADQAPEAMEVLTRLAREKNAPLSAYRKDFFSELLSETDPLSFTFRSAGVLANIAIPLRGEHQVTNASLACRTAELIASGHPEMSLDIKGGIEGTRWPGRLEMISDAPPIMIDGAHNPDAAAALAVYLKRVLGRNYKRIIAIFGIMADKDIRGILGPLMPLSAEIIFTAPAYGRAASPEVLAAEASASGRRHHKAGTVAEAITLAKALCAQGDLILITGSFYTIGEAREALGLKGVLTRLRE
ncbi:MAG: bifunctional folylpolyglutamate synthase/dihydrofolate synthase [Nitrospirae bacterium]|nr:bifunctional folylpolyglutamate synthase/dihydrofolate synthase [Nitrospirota bacterium]